MNKPLACGVASALDLFDADLRSDNIIAQKASAIITVQDCIDGVAERKLNQSTLNI